MWIGVLWAGLRVAMCITYVGGKFRHGLLEKSLIRGRTATERSKKGSEKVLGRVLGPGEGFSEGL